MSEQKSSVVTENICECGICGASADEYPVHVQCTENPHHFADTLTHIFADFTPKEKP